MNTSDKILTDEEMNQFEKQLVSIYRTLPVGKPKVSAVLDILQNNIDQDPYCLGSGYRAAANDTQNSSGIMVYETDNGEFQLVVQPSAEVSKEGMITLSALGDSRLLLENKTVAVVNESGTTVIQGPMQNGKMIGIVADYLSLDLGKVWQVKLIK